MLISYASTSEKRTNFEKYYVNQVKDVVLILPTIHKIAYDFIYG